MKEKKLCSRQWDLYNLLELFDGEPLSLKAICTVMGAKYNECKFNGGCTFNNSSARRTITRDIQAINEDNTTQKIIYCDSNGVRLLTEGNANVLLEKEEIKIKKMFKRLYHKKKKCNLNNQGRIVFNSEKEYIESLLK